MNSANNLRDSDPLAQTMRVRIGEMNLPSAQDRSPRALADAVRNAKHVREVDPIAETMRISLREPELPRAEGRGLYELLLEKADAILQRGGGTDMLMRLVSLPTGATLAALTIGMIFRTFKLPQ